MAVNPEDRPPNRLDDVPAVERESAMLIIWALLGLLLIVLFSVALWA